jgi:hypothetical protein
VNVTLSKVYFEDYLTGNLTDITAAWKAGECTTRAYTGSPTITSAGTAVDASCTFSAADTSSALESTSAMCQGFVKAVYYKVNHGTDESGAISAVSATVTLTDVPIEDAGDVVTVAQTFAVAFTSADATDVSSDNGNIVKRCASTDVPSVPLCFVACVKHEGPTCYYVCLPYLHDT